MTSPYLQAPRQVQPLTPRLDRIATAYHEAGHCIVGRWYGQYLRDTGVEIDARQFCALRVQTWDNTPESCAVVGLAGLCAEWRWRPCRWHLDFSILEILEDLRDRKGSQDLGDFWCGDSGDVDDWTKATFAVFVENPRATDEQVLRRLRDYRRRTQAIVDHPIIWRCIDKVAHAVLERGQLLPDEFDVLVEQDEDLQTVWNGAHKFRNPFRSDRGVLRYNLRKNRKSRGRGGWTASVAAAAEEAAIPGRGLRP